jgi:hypothetical protein
MAFKVLEILGFIGRLMTASIMTNNTRPPSKAGNGIRFMTAKFKEIKATKPKK